MTSHQFSRVFRKPLRPYEKERFHAELKIVGEYGLKNKRELWRVQFALAKIRKAARVLLTLPPEDEKRKFESAALLRRLTKLGVLDETKQKLDYVLSLTPGDLLDRRLQTLVQKLGLAKSMHESRTLVSHRHIAVGSQLVNQPGFLVWKESENSVGLAKTSVKTTEKGGRKARMRLKAASKKQEAKQDSD